MAATACGSGGPTIERAAPTSVDPVGEVAAARSSYFFPVECLAFPLDPGGPKVHGMIRNMGDQPTGYHLTIRVAGPDGTAIADVDHRTPTADAEETVRIDAAVPGSVPKGSTCSFTDVRVPRS